MYIRQPLVLNKCNYPLYLNTVDPAIGIQRKRKELTDTCMMISKEKNSSVSMVYTKIFERCIVMKMN